MQKEERSKQISFKIEIFESSYINRFLIDLSKNAVENEIDPFYYNNFLNIFEKDLIRKNIFHSSYSEILNKILKNNK